MSYPQFQAASDYLGAIADEDYVKALPSNSYEDRGGAVLDGPEAGYKVTYTQADAEAVTAEDGRVILMDEHLADSDAMDYDMDRADGEWALSDYVQKGIEASVYKGYKRDKIEMRGDRAEMSDFPLYLNTVAGGLDRRDQTIGGFSFVVKIYAVPVVEIIR